MKPPNLKFILATLLAVSAVFAADVLAEDITIDSNATWTTGVYDYNSVLVTNNAVLTFSGSVTLNAQILIVDSGASISAKGTGFPGEQGPGVGGFYNGHATGGGYGGRGGSFNDSGGITYGSALFPTDLGSGGGNSNLSINVSGAGGGAIRLDVADLTVNGAINAHGEDGNATYTLTGGGGSGGSIYITTEQLAGSGSIRANGGYGKYGGGGGGRVAVYYSASGFNGIIEAKGGTASDVTAYGQDGTVALVDTANNVLYTGHSFRFEQTDSPLSYNRVVLNGSKVSVDGSVALTANELSVDTNSTFTISGDTTTITVVNLSVTGGSNVSLTGNSNLAVTGAVNLANSTIATAGPQNLTLTSQDITLATGGTLKWGSGSYAYNNIYLTDSSMLVFDGSVALQANSITIDPCCFISAKGTGYPGEQGPGVGGVYNGHATGGGYGGRGGSFNDSGGITYGSALFPTDLGSGGGNSNLSINVSGAGGGAIRIDVGTLTVNGIINADGTDGSTTYTLTGGGGSGGSIYITAEQFAGSGSIRANGGYGRYGGGGGGRVAVYYSASGFNGIVEAKGGTGQDASVYGQNGTVVLQGPSLEDSPATATQASAGFVSQDTLSETLRLLTANLTDTQISGDFNGVMNFSGFEVVTIESGSFVGQGFAKANWQTNLDGLDYAGSWRAVVTRVQTQTESTIYLKGVISGDISGITEGTFIESSSDPNVGLDFNSKWMLNKMKNQTVASTIELSGVLSSPQTTDYPATALYVLQGSFDASSYGHYTGPLGIILTHVRVASGSACYGEGFSKLSYTCDVGQGLASAYNTLESPTVATLKGSCDNPLLGVLTATLNEGSSPKRLSVTIERVDLGLPPQPVLSVRVLAPPLVSPGQTVSYVIEYSNDGTKPAENVSILHKLPKDVEVLSYSTNGHYSATGIYNGASDVSWTFDSLPPQSKGYLATIVKVDWGLSELDTLNTHCFADSYEVHFDPNITLDSTVVESNDTFVGTNHVFAVDNNSAWTLNTTCQVSEPDVEMNEPNLVVTTTETTFASLLKFKANPAFRIEIIGDRGYYSYSLHGLIEGYIMKKDIARKYLGRVGVSMSERAFLQWLYYNDFIDLADYKKFTTTSEERVIVYWNGSEIIEKFDEAGPYFDYITEGVLDNLIHIPADELGATIAAFEAQKETPRIRTDSPENAIHDSLKFYLDNYGYGGQRPPWWDAAFRENVEKKLWMPWRDDMPFLTIRQIFCSFRQWIAAALDPNKKYGPQGKVLPGQKLDYKVEFENVGEGIAFGVYFTDTLDEDVNDATLQVGPVIDVNTGAVLAGPGTYNPATRTITWFVGQVDPNQGGYAEFSVDVDTEAQHGTEIINYATIYFPSVPQELRTNGIVSTVLLNQPPTANAGPDQSVHIGDTVVLDGSSSTDPDGDILTFKWTFGLKPAGSQAVLTGPNSLNPSFVPDLHGTYTVTLVVNDGNEDSKFDVVKISTVNVAPVANAGNNQTVHIGDTVTLDASGSTDSDGDLLTYRWTFESIPAGSTAVLDDPNSVNSSFVADAPGDYVVRLVVNDGLIDSEPDTVVISTINLVPIANAGEDQAVYVGDLVTLDGSASSDPDGDPLVYLWVFTVLPEGSTADLNDANSVHPTFTADLPGTYVLSLIVNDGLQDSAPDTVTISTINVAPIADAGPDQMVYVGDVVDLNGSGSWDPDGDSLTYSWNFTTLPADSTAVLNNADTATPDFTADKPGTYVVSLTVSDGWLTSAPDTVTVSTTNVAPTADAGDDQSVVIGNVVTLDGSQSSDPDGDLLTYNWAFTSKPPGSIAVLVNPTSVDSNFTADVPGIYVISLVVSDGTAFSAPDSITVSAVSQQTWAIEITQQIIQTINAMDRHNFRNRRNKRVLTKKLNAVIDRIEREHYRIAIMKLRHDILRKTDGCAEIGHPDHSDWIINCDAQASVYPLIVEVIDILETTY